MPITIKYDRVLNAINYNYKSWKDQFMVLVAIYAIGPVMRDIEEVVKWLFKTLLFFKLVNVPLKLTVKSYYKIINYYFNFYLGSWKIM